jgi:hypothetical protein
LPTAITAGGFTLKVLVNAKRMIVLSRILSTNLLGTTHDTCLLIIGNPFFEEICLPCQGDIFHDWQLVGYFHTGNDTIERVGGIIVFLVAQGDQETISDELDVLFHEFGVDTEQRARQAFSQEALFNFDGFGDDVLNRLFAWTLAEVGEE